MTEGGKNKAIVASWIAGITTLFTVVFFPLMDRMETFVKDTVEAEADTVFLVKKISFRDELVKELHDAGYTDVTKEDIPKMFASSYVWSDSIQSFDKHLKPILTFLFSHQFVGPFVRKIDGAVIVYPPNLVTEPYRAHRIDTGMMKGYFQYFDATEGVLKYVWVN